MLHAVQAVPDEVMRKDLVHWLAEHGIAGLERCARLSDQTRKMHVTMCRTASLTRGGAEGDVGMDPGLSQGPRLASQGKHAISCRHPSKAGSQTSAMTDGE